MQCRPRFFIFIIFSSNFRIFKMYTFIEYPLKLKYSTPLFPSVTTENGQRTDQGLDYPFMPQYKASLD